MLTSVTTNSTAANFQIYTIAAVTHGQMIFGAPSNSQWMEPLANGLKNEGYNAVVQTYWNNLSVSPGQAEAAAFSMYYQLVADAGGLSGLQPNDIIDVQLIGFSRGASVIGVAMNELVTDYENMVTNLQDAAQLQHGYYEMTFLDPHPANSGTNGQVGTAGLQAAAAFFSLNWTVGEIATVVANLGNDLVNAIDQDPAITVPPRVNQVVDYYQHNDNFALSLRSVENSYCCMEAVFNLWGDPAEITIADPATTLSATFDISSFGVGHGEVPLWFGTNLQVLTNGSPPPNPLPSSWLPPASWSSQSGSSSPDGNSPPPDGSSDSDQLLVFPASLEDASGAASSVYVLAATPAGNLDPNFNGSVTLSLQDANGATLGGTVTENAVNGVAEFTNVSIGTPGDGYVLQASNSTADSGDSPPVDVSTDQLVVTTGPASIVSVGSSYPIVVEAEDGGGNLDSSFNGQVAVTVTDPSDDSVISTVTLNAVNGTASGAVTTTQSDAFILAATSDGVAEAVSPIDVTPVIVTGVSPATGPSVGGTSVTITGTDLAGTALVDFGSNPGTIVSDSGTQIVAVSPAGPVGTVDVTVTTADGTSATSSANQFTYIAPAVTGVSPASGPLAGGTTVTITGTGFSAATAVDFGAVAASSVIVNSDTQITAVSPAGTVGTVDVTVTTADGTSATSPANQFTYVASVSNRNWINLGMVANDSAAEILTPTATVYGTTGNGTGYQNGDIVTLPAYATLANISTTGYSIAPASFRLTVVNGNVTAVTLVDSGDYPWTQNTSPAYPSNPVSVTGGSGTGLKLSVTWGSGSAMDDSGDWIAQNVDWLDGLGTALCRWLLLRAMHKIFFPWSTIRSMSEVLRIWR